ncbi:MAG: hypothetical protein ACOZF2_14150 [Thermodesulfobacteriota bacterium]
MADVIDVRGLDEKEIEIIEVLVESLRERARLKAVRKKKDGFKRSAGAWRGLIDPEALITDIYASRLASSVSGPET